MKKSFLSIIISLVLIINMFTCHTVIAFANNKESNKTTTIQNNSNLEKGINELLEKDFIKSLMDNQSIHEIFADSLNNGILKNLGKDINKSLADISIDIDNFKTNESTYKWLSNAIISVLKNAINKGIIKQSDIDSLNSAIGILGIKKISIDLTKKNYTNEEIEKTALELLPVLDRLLNPFLLKLIGIDLKSQKFWDDFTKIIQNAIK